MSRTYRCKKEKDSYLIEENRVLGKIIFTRIRNWDWYRIEIDPKSKEGKKMLAKFHSDSNYGVYEWKGPNWFHNMYAQRPYRRDCKKQIKKFMNDPEYEIQIRNKPYREYWD